MKKQLFSLGTESTVLLLIRHSAFFSSSSQPHMNTEADCVHCNSSYYSCWLLKEAFTLIFRLVGI